MSNHPHKAPAVFKIGRTEDNVVDLASFKKRIATVVTIRNGAATLSVILRQSLTPQEEVSV